MRKKIYYYHKDKKDDFGNIGHNNKPLKDNFKYVNTNIFYRFISFIFYYFLAFPILFVVSKMFLGVKVIGKKNIKKELKKNEGYFIYSNHCHYYDAFLSHMFAGFPKRTYVLSHADPANIFFIKHLVMLLGCLPLPNNKTNYKNFINAMKYRFNNNGVIAIYPEGTLWPYYNNLRPFEKTSFKYAAMLKAPIVVTAETFRKPKIFHFLKPRMTITISNVIRYDDNLSVDENATIYYQKTLKFLKEHVINDNNISYHNYIQID